jgi:hypothetical protein
VALAPGQHAPLDEARLAAVQLEPTAARGGEGDLVVPATAGQPPSAGVARGRQAVSLTLGGTLLGGPSSAVDGSQATTSATANLLATVGYAYWVGDRVALKASAGVRSAHGDETSAGGTKTTNGAAIASLLVGAKLGAPLGAARQVFVSGALDAGVLIGATDSETTGGGTTQTTTHVESKPALRLGLGADWFPLRHLVLGVDLGYLFAQEFEQPIASRRSYSGFDAGISAGFAWGGR